VHLTTRASSNDNSMTSSAISSTTLACFSTINKLTPWSHSSAQTSVICPTIRDASPKVGLSAMSSWDARSVGRATRCRPDDGAVQMDTRSRRRWTKRPWPAAISSSTSTRRGSQETADFIGQTRSAVLSIRSTSGDLATDVGGSSPFRRSERTRTADFYIAKVRFVEF